MVISSFYCYSFMKKQRKDSFYYKVFFIKAVGEILCLKKAYLMLFYLQKAVISGLLTKKVVQSPNRTTNYLI